MSSLKTQSHHKVVDSFLRIINNKKWSCAPPTRFIEDPRVHYKKIKLAILIQNPWLHKNCPFRFLRPWCARAHFSCSLSLRLFFPIALAHTPIMCFTPNSSYSLRPLLNSFSQFHHNAILSHLSTASPTPFPSFIKPAPQTLLPEISAPPTSPSPLHK